MTLGYRGVWGPLREGQYSWVRIKGCNSQGSNLDLVALVDFINLFNSAEIHKNTRRIKKDNEHMCSLFLLVFLYISAELNKLPKSPKSTKTKLPP